MSSERDPVRVVCVGPPERRDGLAEALKGVGPVRTATAEEALGAVATGAVDCLVAGHDPPAFDGLALLATVRETHPELPVVLSPHRGSERLAGEAIAAGVTDYVPAALADDELAERVVAAVETPREGPDGREREDRHYRTIVESSSDPMYTLDTAGRLTFANRAAEELTGFEETALLGEHVSAVIDDEDVARGTEVIEALLRGEAEGPTVVEMEIETADGGTIPCENHIALLEVDGEVVGTTGVLRDISERLEAKRRLTQLAERTPDVLWMFSADWSELLFVNDAYETVWGRSVDALRADPTDFLRGIHPDDRERVREGMAEIQEGEAVEMEYRVDESEGYERWVTVRGEPVMEDGEVDRVVGFVRDITERKRREERLRRQNDRLSEFASIVSHDLRNPLAVATGTVDLLRTEGGADPERLDAIERAHDRMAAIIDDLLALARSGQRVGDRVPVDLGQVATAAWEGIESPEATLSVEGEGVTVSADAGRLRELLENLFRNSVEHAGPDVTVRVRATTDGFAVTDNGPGIPTDERDRVLEAGYSTEHRGTGLGLAIVEEIAEGHGWSVRVTESEAGGARFELTATAE